MTAQEAIALHTTDDAGCLVWQRACTNGHPAMRHNSKTTMVRRALWQELHGSIPAGHILHMTCNTHLCVNPECLSLTTPQKLGKKLGAAGMMSGPVRSAAIARAKRKTQAKLTDTAVQEIRSSTGTGAQLATRYGVSQSHISKIRKHKCWRNFSSPWAGL